MNKAWPAVAGVAMLMAMIAVLVWPRRLPEPRQHLPEAPRPQGKLLIMSATDHGWNHDDAGSQAQSEPDQGVLGKRRSANWRSNMFPAGPPSRPSLC